MPQSIYDNGGMVGVTLDFGDTEKYIIGTTTTPATITHVGSSGIGTVTASGATSMDLPTGLLPGDLVLVAFASDNDKYDDVGDPPGYTLVGFDDNGVGAAIWYKFMGEIPDTQVTIDAGGNSNTSYLCSVYRGVDSSTPLANTPAFANASSGMPNPPSVSATSGQMVIPFGFLDDDRLTPAAPTDYTLSASSSSQNSGSTVMTAYLLADSDATYDAAAFDGGGSDIWLASTLVLNQGTEVVSIYGNQKNSGIWSLSSVLENAPITTSVAFTHIATLETANSGGNIDLSSYQVGDVAVALAYRLDTTPYTVTEPGAGWTSAVSQYVPSTENAAYSYDFSWDAWYKALTVDDLSTGADFQSGLLRSYGTVLIFRPSTALSSLTLVRALTSHSPTGIAPTPIGLLTSSDPSNSISIAQTSFGTGTVSYSFSGPAYISKLNDAQGSTLHSHYRITTTEENNTLSSGDTASSINVLFGITLSGAAIV